MYRVGVKLPFNVGHFLIGDFDEESIPHRHDYQVEWIFEIESLDANGFSVDISHMETLLRAVSTEIEGLLLNDLPFFENRQSSVENFARYTTKRLKTIARKEAMSMFDRATSVELLVWESPTAWASYRE